MTRVIEVRVPDMGNFKDVAVIDVLVKAGDRVLIQKTGARSFRIEVRK